jgi:hypothetical protein
MLGPYRGAAGRTAGRAGTGARRVLSVGARDPSRRKPI